MVEHHIQRDILSQLMHAPVLRFSELKPTGMESNIFMYHLHALIKDGYVEKLARGYQLGPQGLIYVDSLSLKDHKPRKQPKVVCMIVLRDQKSGKWLLARRKLQPFIGQYTFVSGKQHFGESPHEHAEREVFEKTGLHLPLERVGMVDIRIRKSEMLITHIFGYVYEGQTNSQVLSDTVQYTNEWYQALPLDDPHKLLMVGTREIYDALLTRGGKPFFLSVEGEE